MAVGRIPQVLLDHADQTPHLRIDAPADVEPPKRHLPQRHVQRSPPYPHGLRVRVGNLRPDRLPPLHRHRRRHERILTQPHARLAELPRRFAQRSPQPGLHHPRPAPQLRPLPNPPRQVPIPLQINPNLFARPSCRPLPVSAPQRLQHVLNLLPVRPRQQHIRLIQHHVPRPPVEPFERPLRSNHRPDAGQQRVQRHGRRHDDIRKLTAGVVIRNALRRHVQTTHRVVEGPLHHAHHLLTQQRVRAQDEHGRAKIHHEGNRHAPVDGLIDHPDIRRVVNI